MNYNFGELLSSLNNSVFDVRITALKTCLQVAISSNHAHYSAQFADLIARLESQEEFYKLYPSLYSKQTDDYFHRAIANFVELNNLIAVKS